jgi:hypothetical protein
MKYVVVVGAIIIFCAATSAVQTPSLCDASEAIIFSCRIKGSNKILSLCSSKQLSKDAGYLQYRFGRPDAVELTFPEEKRNSQTQFLYNHYFRFQVDRTEVSFKNGGYRYSIYDYYDAETKPEKMNRGVSIEYEGSEEKSVGSRDFECTGPVISGLRKLKDVIPCDKENALGCP